MKVLIHKTDHLGDFVLGLPVLWEVGRYVGSEGALHVLADPRNEAWCEILPWLKYVHSMEHPRYHPRSQEPWVLRVMRCLTMGGSLRKVGFDWGIDLVSTRNDWLGKGVLYAAGCRFMSGPDGAYSFVLARRYREVFQHQTGLLADRCPREWGITGRTDPELFMPSSLRWEGGESFLLLAPFAGTQAKRWGWEYWRELMGALGKMKMKFLIPEADLEEWRSVAIFLGIKPEQVIVVSNVRESLEAVRTATCVVGMDTAVVHFAWLTGTPFVQLFSGTTEAERWAPRSGGEILEVRPFCSPCHKEECFQARHICMEDLTVDRVCSAIERMVCQGQVGRGA